MRNLYNIYWRLLLEVDLSVNNIQKIRNEINQETK